MSVGMLAWMWIIGNLHVHNKTPQANSGGSSSIYNNRISVTGTSALTRKTDAKQARNVLSVGKNVVSGAEAFALKLKETHRRRAEGRNYTSNNSKNLNVVKFLQNYGTASENCVRQFHFPSSIEPASDGCHFIVYNNSIMMYGNASIEIALPNFRFPPSIYLGRCLTK